MTTRERIKQIRNIKRELVGDSMARKRLVEKLIELVREDEREKESA